MPAFKHGNPAFTYGNDSVVSVDSATLHGYPAAVNVPPKSRDRPAVNSVAQAAAVLRHLSTIEEGQGVTSIAGQVGISPSSCFNILKTLVDEDLVEFDVATKRYRLGGGVVDLARSALARDDTLAAARPLMERFAERWDVTAGLWRVSGRSRLVMVASAESSSPARLHLVVGQRQPLAAGAAGRALLATQNLDRISLGRMFEELRWGQPPVLEEYLCQISAAADEGFAIDNEQFLRGIVSVAAPVVPQTGAVRYCMTASMFAGRHNDDGLRIIGAELRQMADSMADGCGRPPVARSARPRR